MKKILLLTLMIVLSFGVISCSEEITTTLNGTDTGDSTNPGYLTTITFWNIFTGPDGEVMSQMVNDFNTEYDGVYKVLTQTIPANDFYDKMNTAVPLGQGPDVAIMHLDRISRYAKLGLLNSFEDLGMQLNLTKDDYIDVVWEAGIYNNERYGVPLDVHPIGLYYNKDILDEYDVEVPTTWDELISACAILNDPSNDQYCLPMSNVWPSQYVFQAALYQNGGTDLDKDGLYPAFNTNAGFTALKRLHNAVYTYGISPANVTVDEEGANFTFNGSWDKPEEAIVSAGKNDVNEKPYYSVYFRAPKEDGWYQQIFIPKAYFTAPETIKYANGEERILGITLMSAKDPTQFYQWYLYEEIDS